MTIAIIITICLLLLLAYVFDISSPLTKIPSVILLLLLGWFVKQITDIFHLHTPDLNPLLPIFGTIGLILIVLEGSLELELNKSKLPIITKSILNALIPMFALAFLFAFTFQYFGQVSYKVALVNAIPFCVISSAIAIPSVRNLSPFNKEFIIYESSLSDIFGVLFFNFIALNEIINEQSFANFALELLLIIAISFISVLGLSFLLSRIKHHITFTPIILMVILIYAVSKVYHLPGLIFILVFGLFLGNLDELKRFKWIEKLKPEKLDKEVKKFKEITVEATFLIRALFFMLFGFLMEAKEIFNPKTILWAAGIVLSIIIIRWLALKTSKLPTSPLLFVAPRGLITILLFLSILPEQTFALVNKALIIQTIILSVLVMMFGIMASGKTVTKTIHNV
ncbi:MAG: sodium:proton antiporter [Saprospiraceae bacterium]|nr:sodium:proton antiporter [Saprospiraceae bacterium]MBK9726619.1 sodium:proton antiporter [Saprospiraceae bacterium]